MENLNKYFIMFLGEFDFQSEYTHHVPAQIQIFEQHFLFTL